ncbi:hypothetical protein D3I60_04425 [Brevibacterium permense]|nr:hypothetical protein [Brevibacterium permense]
MTWHRVESRPQAPPGKYLDALRSELGGRDDDEQVQMTVGQVRELLDALAPPKTLPGAQVYDPERGVTYRVTLQGEAGDRSLRTVEVIPDEGVVDPSVYRVPASLLTAMTAEVVAATKGGRVTLDNRNDVARGHRPSAQELAQLIREEHTRNSIAEKFDRKVSTVDQWLRRARRELPDEFPEATRGPKSTSK